MKYYIAGAGGFIGGHLVNRLIESGNEVIAVDVKHQDEWFQINNKAKNFILCLIKLFEDAIPINIPAIIGKKIKNDNIPPGIN